MTKSNQKTQLAKEMIKCSKQIYELKLLEQLETNPGTLETLIKKRKELQYQCLLYLEQLDNMPGQVDDQEFDKYMDELRKS